MKCHVAHMGAATPHATNNKAMMHAHVRMHAATTHTHTQAHVTAHMRMHTLARAHAHETH